MNGVMQRQRRRQTSLRPAKRSARTFDEWVDGWFEGFRGHRRLQRVLYAASLAAESALLLGGGATAVIDSPRADVTRHRVVSVAIAAASTGVTKRLVGRRRPFEPGQRPVRVSPDTTSFPSGHTLWAVLAAAWLAEDRWPTWLAYATAGFVGVSRVHLRLHRTSDVAAAAAIAAAAWTVASRSETHAGPKSSPSAVGDGPGGSDAGQHSERA